MLETQPSKPGAHLPKWVWWVVVLWMVLLGVLPAVLRPNPHDFGQYYMGGLMADKGREGFASLYPIPLPGAVNNPGYKWASTMKPAYAAAAYASGVGDDSRYIQPPPVAVALMGLSKLPFKIAYPLWAGLMGFCLAGCMIIGVRLLRLCGDIPRWVQFVLVLLWVASPLGYRVLRTGQIGPFVALFVGATLEGVLTGWGSSAALAAVFGGFAKGATAALAPLLILPDLYHRWQWRTVVWLVVFTGLAIGITLLASGTAVWHEYLRQIVPNLDRSDTWAGNQSLHGFLLRTHLATMTTDLRPVRWVLGIGVVAAAFFARRRLGNKPDRRTLTISTLALAYLCISALLIGAPIAWEHYMIYFWPLWGWLMFEAISGPVWKRTVALWSMTLQWAPWCVMIPLAEPVRSHMLAAMCLGCVVGGWRLINRGRGLTRSPSA